MKIGTGADVQSRALGFFPFILVVAGCHLEEKVIPVSNSEITLALRAAEMERQDQLALLPDWYREGCEPSWDKKSTTEKDGFPPLIWVSKITESALPSISPVPLWRLLSLGVFFLLPAAVLEVCINVDDENDLTKAWGVLPARSALACAYLGIALAIPFVLCYPVKIIFGTIAYGVAGNRGYYIPWHYAAFLCFSFVLLIALVSVANSVACALGIRRRTNPGHTPKRVTAGIVAGAVAVFVFLWKMLDAGFTARDLIQLVVDHSF